MAGKKRLSNLPRAAKCRAVPFVFKIDVYSPETIPMLRLAEYMGELARLLGETTAVHFDKVEPGSTVLKYQVEWEATPKVRERTRAVHAGNAPKEIGQHYRRLNEMLRSDNASAINQEEKRGAKILRFPGRDEALPEPIIIKQRGSLDGLILRVGGADATAHVQIQAENKRIGSCVTTRQIAKQLAGFLYETVRLHGIGKWTRDTDGNWNVDEFKIESFDALTEMPLSDALEELRKIGGDWGDNAIAELQELRTGTKRLANGGN